MSETKRTVVKKVENCVLYSDGLIKVENVRLSYPHLDKPYAGKPDASGKTGEPKYSVTALLNKTTHKAAQALILAQINEICTAKKWMKDGKRTIPSSKLCLKNGDEEAKEEYAGMWSLNAREKIAPKLRDKRKNRVEQSQAAEMFYPGCWSNVVIKLWPQDNSYGKRINANLTMVQFVKDDSSFGEGRISDDDADDLLDSVDDDDADGGDGDDNDDL